MLDTERNALLFASSRGTKTVYPERGLAVGQRIVCPRCERPIATVVKPVRVHEVLAADAFEWADGVDYEEGDAAACPGCLENWLRPIVVLGGDAFHVRDADDG